MWQRHAHARAHTQPHARARGAPYTTPYNNTSTALRLPPDMSTLTPTRPAPRPAAGPHNSHRHSRAQRATETQTHTTAITHHHSHGHTAHRQYRPRRRRVHPTRTPTHPHPRAVLRTRRSREVWPFPCRSTPGPRHAVTRTEPPQTAAGHTRKRRPSLSPASLTTRLEAPLAEQRASATE